MNNLNAAQTERVLEIDEQILRLSQEKISILSQPSQFDWLPAEVMLLILKALPDFCTLGSMILTCQHFARVFTAHREEILFAILANDVGTDIMVDYQQIDYLMQTPHVSGASVGIDYGDVAADRIVRTIQLRGLYGFTPSFRFLSEPLFVYIVKQANFVNRALELLIRDVLFGDVTPGESFKAEKLLHHTFLAHASRQSKSHPHFDMTALTAPLDAAETRRFKRGLHRLHICRILCTGGLDARPLAPRFDPIGWMSDPNEFNTFLHFTRTIPRGMTLRAATLGAMDFAIPFTASYRPMMAFLLSLSPWEQEEVAACGKLVARGYGRAARLASVSNRDYSVPRMHHTVLLHLGALVAVLREPATFRRHVRPRVTMQNYLFAANAFAHADVFWKICLTHAATAVPRGVSMDKHLLRTHLLGPTGWLTQAYFAGPYAHRFDAEAAPLHRAMVEVVLATHGRSPREKLKPQQFVEDCWALWSHPARIRAWPRFPALVDALKELYPGVYI